MTNARLLTGSSPRAVNPINAPEQVKAVSFQANADGPGRWRVELPPHSIATVQFSA